jgi:hypothetical protein
MATSGLFLSFLKDCPQEAKDLIQRIAVPTVRQSSAQLRYRCMEVWLQYIFKISSNSHENIDKEASKYYCAAVKPLL